MGRPRGWLVGRAKSHLFHPKTQPLSGSGGGRAHTHSCPPQIPFETVTRSAATSVCFSAFQQTGKSMGEAIIKVASIKLLSWERFYSEGGVKIRILSLFVRRVFNKAGRAAVAHYLNGLIWQDFGRSINRSFLLRSGLT